MKRFTDMSYTAFYHSGTFSEFDVKCLKCRGFGIVTTDKTIVFFKCTACGHTQKKEHALYTYNVENLCKCCKRFYRVDINDEQRQHFRVLNVSCPYCKTVMPGQVRKTNKTYYYINGIKNGREPYFGLELWFLSSFQGKPIWALNREHLAYLIDYLSADLRERPADHRAQYGTMRTQSDHLPAFMKTAKNRERIVMVLKNLQNT